MSSGASVLLVKSKIAILEDDETFSRDIKAQLEASGRVECVPASTLKQFVQTIDSCVVDAASIDWRLGQFTHGGEALDYVEDRQPAAGRLVYTYFPQYSATAREHQTDYFVQKQQYEGPAGYLEKALAAIRLGLSRRTLALLHAFGELSSLEQLSSESLDSRIENDIYETARRRLLHDLLHGTIDDLLKDVVVRAGRWRALNKAAYTRLSWRKKLSEICGFAGLTPDDLASILGSCGKDSESLLHGREDSDNIPPQLRQNAEYLMAIFSYVLQLADYQPEAVAHYWTVEGLYEKSAGRPPWDQEGIAKYLRQKKCTGLEEAVLWIRSH